MSDVFEKRLRRAEVLQKEWPFAAELLGFYRNVWALQKEALEQGSESIVPRLLSLVLREGPPDLAREAASFPNMEEALRRYAEEGLPESPALEFFAKVLEQIGWISIRRKNGEPAPLGETSIECPGCAGLPVVSVLREDKSAETVRRSLVCGRCYHEWSFARVLCPHCKEEKPEKLPRYTAQEIPWMRVEACDSCGKFIKSVDLTLNWDAEPVVDELASTPLDVIAHEHGYTKIAPNLAGI